MIYATHVLNKIIFTVFVLSALAPETIHNNDEKLKAIKILTPMS